MTAAAARILSESEKRNVVIGVLVAMFLATLDQTIVAPALPTIGARLGDVDFLPWIVSAYLLTSTAVTPLYGKLSDIHGRRPVLICGLLIFLVGSIVCALAILVCERILRDLPQHRRPHRLDILGSALMIGASVGLMLALTLGGLRYPWTSTPILALGAATLALAAWFAIHLTRAPEPLIPLSIFANDVVGKASGALFFSMFAFVGATVYLPIYFEYQLGLTPTEAGAGLIVLLGGSVIGANTAGRYMPHVVHYKRMAYAGLFLGIASLAALAALAPYLNFAAAQVLVLGVGLGLGPLFPTTTVAVQNAVDPRDLGIATGTLAFVRTFGSALGVAAFGAIIFAFGLVAVEGGGPPAVGVRPDLEALAGDAFRAAFAAMALAATIAMGFFALMEERPLRGPAKSPAAPEA